MMVMYCRSSPWRWRLSSVKSFSDIRKRLFSGATVDVGKEVLKLSPSPYARMADGSAIASVGDTSVLVIAVSKAEGRAGVGFLPLTVDYRLKAAAAGRIPTNFLKRELGATTKEILSSRMLDRSIRPLFPAGYNCETQVTCNTLSIDPEHDPDIVSINAAATALALSNIPWDGPLGAVRVGLVDGKFVLNPTRKDRSKSKLDLIISAVQGRRVLMLDGSAENISLPDLKKGIDVGVGACMNIIRTINELRESVGKPKRSYDQPETVPVEVLEAAETICSMRLREIFTDPTYDKVGRDIAATEVRTDTLEQLKESYPDVNPSLISSAINSLSKEIFRSAIFDRKLRCDGRTLDGLRNISCQVDLFPNTLHGSALFQRGQTQVLATLAFDSIASSLRLDPISAVISGVKEKNFFLHYEFPQYATNDLSRGPVQGRRELGHGALAEKALRPIIPPDFPHTIRLTAEVLESNGSSSMASVCAGSLALMDAGVPVPGPAAGVAVGLVTKGDVRSIPDDDLEYLILTDLLGLEDYAGDMDFKIAGTKLGITALQLDLKLPGVPLKVIEQCLERGVIGKNQVIAIMDQTIDKPRKERKPNSPVVEEYEVPVHKLGRFLGVGGSFIKKIAAETGVQIHNVEGLSYQIFAPNPQAMMEAKQMIEEALESSRDPALEFGSIYTAKIVEVRDIGVMVQLYPTMSPALIHNSQLDRRKIQHPSALGMEVGHEIKVKFFGRDPVSGAMRLSRKVLTGPTSAEINLNPVKKSGSEKA
ncbi:unnamed protein product [Cyprideis torosa]|uniref:polyribonucleotide nucleotidyltransferase n=1 Tax=Cyprideis torosa TaxID=163714 RepID=A0A7R8WIS2_9CRUS|nr:unnamed protein product [Cyprideis torosa]CAG0901104.1 unnamed protein product [Cyprideis torosa]